MVAVRSRAVRSEKDIFCKVNDPAKKIHFNSKRATRRRRAAAVSVASYANGIASKEKFRGR